MQISQTLEQAEVSKVTIFAGQLCCELLFVHDVRSGVATTRRWLGARVEVTFPMNPVGRCFAKMLGSAQFCSLPFPE